MLLKNKTAIITGCNRGIGKCILETFVKNGANIIACIRKENLSFSLFVEDLQKKYNAYSSLETLTSQIVSFSDIQNEIMDYNWLIK